jgi:hypothetical protein
MWIISLFLLISGAVIWFVPDENGGRLLGLMALAMGLFGSIGSLVSRLRGGDFWR